MQLNDKIALKKLREAIDAELRVLTTKLGLTDLRTGNISYDASGCEAKIQVIAKAKRADGKTKEELDFIQYAEMYGMKPEWLHRTFDRRGKRGQEAVEIIGLKLTRSKFPVLVQEQAGDGKFLITIEEVQKKFGEPTPTGELELVPPPPRS